MSEHENLEGMEPELEAVQEESAPEAVKSADKPARQDKSKKPPAKKEKPGVFARFSRWLREMRSELKKVQWPSRSQTVNNTLVVISCVLVVGAFIWVFDAIAGGVIQALFALTKG